MRGEVLTRVGLLLLAAAAGVVGVWALVSPEGFFREFPGFGMRWVVALPPYNEHLVNDVGSLNLALAVLTAASAWTLSAALARPVLVAWIVSGVPHLLFHLGHLEPFPPESAASQALALATGVFLPLALLVVGRFRR